MTQLDETLAGFYVVNELRKALEFAAAAFAVIANDGTAAEHSRSFAMDNFRQCKDALNSII